MLFAARFWPGLRDGSITLTFRAWKKPQAAVGKRHRFHSDGALEITSVDQVALGRIAPKDVALTGFASLQELQAALRKAARRPMTDDDRVWRVGLRFVAERDPRLVLGEEPPNDAELATLLTKLARSDARSAAPWTEATLNAIDAHPATPARVLAASVGRERDPFKVDVRKLKKLGLTISLEKGYRLSARGQAVLSALRASRKPIDEITRSAT